MRLIDADALIEKSLKDANCYMDNNDIKHGYHNVQCLIYDAPTIDAVPATIDGALGYLHKVGWIQEHDRIMTEDAAPVRHGHWDVREPMPMHDIKGNLSWGNWYVCTGCGFATTAIEGHITQYKYCPSCGARMDGDSDETD